MPSQRVEKQHVVPRFYLRRFALDDQLALHVIGETGVRLASTRHVCVRKRFYSRKQPDGTWTDDIERSFTGIENRAAPVLRSLVANWQPSRGDKTVLAELIAIQLLRGPGWAAWHRQFVDEVIADVRTSGQFTVAGQAIAVGVHELEELERYLSSDIERFSRMFGLLAKVMGIVGSMHWSLLTFSRPLLASSDHPVVVWPLARGAAEPQAGRFGDGLLPTLEIRFAISPSHALLLTWLDAPDEEQPIIACHRHHAGNLNAFGIAQAERQWFHHPESRPARATGRLLPLAVQLLPGYTAAVAAQSQRRARVSSVIQPLIGSDLEAKATMFSLARRTE